MDPRKQRGDAAERRATQLLIDAGYRIVDLNFRCRVGELDIVARDGDALVFVEVRYRSGDEYGSAVDAIGGRKQHRVVRVARYYLAAIESGANRSGADQPPFTACRFDVVAITGDELVLVKDAFRVR